MIFTANHNPHNFLFYVKLDEKHRAALAVVSRDILPCSKMYKYIVSGVHNLILLHSFLRPVALKL